MFGCLTSAEYEVLLRHDFTTFVTRCFGDLNPQTRLAMNWHLEVWFPLGGNAPSSRSRGTAAALLVENLDREAQPCPQQRSAVNSCDVVAGGANEAWRLLADKLVVTDLGATGFKIVGDLVIIMRRAAEQHL